MTDAAPSVIRLRLRANGFDPIPVEGKAPRMSGWTEMIGATPDQIRLWDSVWNLARNTGVLAKRTPGRCAGAEASRISSGSCSN